MKNIAYVFFLVFVFTVPLADSIRLGGIASLPAFIGIASLTFILLAVFSREIPLKSFGFPHILISIFIFWVALSYFWSFSPETTIIRVFTYLQILLFIWMLCQFTHDDRCFLGVIHAYVLGSIATSIHLIYSWKQGVYYRESLDRITASAQDPNDQALMIALCIPLVAFIQRFNKNTYTSLLFYITVFTSVFAIVLTGSRGGFIALVACNMYFVLNWKLYSKFEKTLYLSLITISAIAVSMFIPEVFLNRIADIPDQISSRDLTHRVGFWIASLDLFAQHPFIGVGSGGIREGLNTVIGIGPVAHNTFLTIIVELGIFGSTVLVFLLVYIGVKLKKLPDLEFNFWICLLCVLFIGTFALSWEYKKPFWFFLGLVSTRVCKYNNEVTRLA